MVKTKLKINPLEIYLPDGDRKSFLIYGDLRRIMHVERQDEAVKLIRKIIKELKPQPKIYYTELNIGIQSSRSDIIINVLKQLAQFFNSDDENVVSQSEWDNIFKTLASGKAPKRQLWKIGDVFSIPLQDNSYCFGQVVGPYPTIALFDLKKNEESVSFDELEGITVLAILHLTSNRLNNWTWKVLANYSLLANKNSGPFGSDIVQTGHTSFSSNVLESLCNYYWFNIVNWENEDDIKKLLLI